MAEQAYHVGSGLNIDNIEETTQAEIDSYLMAARRNRVPLYAMTANSVWLDNRPDIAKLHQRILAHFRTNLPLAVSVMSFGHLYSYIYLGFEDGIMNEFRALQLRGASRAQLMETVMAAQLYSGIRGLQHVYRATWTFLRDFQDKPEPIPFPDEWSPDPAAFKAGLDTSTPDFTPGDRRALEDWYMRNGGEIPKWVTFTARRNPGFLKAFRLRWEGSFRGALPKQVMPYLMLRHNTLNGLRDGIREAALLGRAWGMTDEWIFSAVLSAAFYFSGMESLNVVEDAIGDLL
ncbi:MAG TPA: hypothetical protein VF937_06460 [Chloroflexota bacterium]